MKTNWEILQPDINAVHTISKIVKCGQTLATILVNRNLLRKDNIISFLNPSLNNLGSPFEIKDMDKAVKRIATAVQNSEKILIFGDYDVDGITATAIVYEFLKKAGADIIFYIPHRIKEGYSIKKENIDYAQKEGVNLIITVDCGSNGFEAAEEAKKAGIDIIITDHHEMPEIFPNAYAIVNPKRKDCNAGFEYFAGVGVAYYLIISLRKYFRDINFWNKSKQEPNLKKICDLVAIGTVADIVPLINENRIFVKIGLENINTQARLGIKKLIKISKINGGKIDAEDISFKLAPRLNAAGRMDSAHYAVRLLTAKDDTTAGNIADSLNQLNIMRQNTEKKALDKIFAYIKQTPDILKRKSLVLVNRDWHEGIIGIMASRIAKKFKRPAVLIALNENFGKGSARSIPGIDIYEAFKKCAGYLDDFGGHPMAAGMKIKIDNIKSFKEHFEKTITGLLSCQKPVADIIIDRKITFADINSQLITELEILKPFGSANPEPLFIAENVSIAKHWIVGKTHKKMLLKDETCKNGRIIQAIQFNIDIEDLDKNKFDYIIFSLSFNRWNGNNSIQLQIKDFL
ncbi:MAG: single-stranded-DNA-specific exonuclease RecJ [Deltaproteobacteria bacterium]|nr:single-stranded-DNA-specific exonuclease RecJ [Deltaproteobacteria bacterium]